MPSSSRRIPPVAAQKPTELTAHGHTRTDAYYWLRLTEAQRTSDPPDTHTQEVLAHLAEENAYSEAVLAPIADLRKALFKEIKGRIKPADLSVPYRENGYWYHHRYEKGKEYPVHVRRKDDEGAATEDILNENELALGATYFDLADYEVSPSNTILGYSVDTVGRRQYEVRFRDLRTGKELPDVITDTGGGSAFADDVTVFYPRQDETLRNYRIYRHILGTDPNTDVMVYEEKDPAFSCDIHRSRSDRFMIISTESSFISEHLYLPVDKPLGTFEVFLPREEDHEHSITHVQSASPEQPAKWYIITNWKATNFRVMECAEGDTRDKKKWKQVLAHDPDVLLEDLDVFKDHLVFSERYDGLSRIRIRRLSDGKEHDIKFNDAAFVCYTGINAEWNSDQLRFGYTSLTTPSSVYNHDLNTGKDTLLKQQKVVGDFNAANYASERIRVKAADGSRVPVSLVYRKGTPLDGSSPLLLYGYGSYGHSIDPMFGSARLSLLDRGFIFAIAHIRGGEELGREWYDNGRMEHKLNTFTDFIDCATALVEKKYADPKKLFAWGGSAGGLLVGAVVNMRPDLWKAVVAEVPFVDVVTTMLDDTIPLTTGEYDEWGDPNDKGAYDRMLSYSPYDNVKDAAYPAMLVITGLHDSQVQYWEPAKWVQVLRKHQLADAPILLTTNMEAGHGGSTGRYEALKETALIYAFLLQEAGLAEG